MKNLTPQEKIEIFKDNYDFDSPAKNHAPLFGVMTSFTVELQYSQTVLAHSMECAIECATSN